MHLKENWAAVLRHAWSIRLALLAALLSGAEVVCAVFTDNPPIERGLFAALAGGVTIAAAIARLIAQKEIE